MFKNLHELIAKMPDEKTCREYLAGQRWNDGIVVCPYCSNRGAYVIEGGKRYKCKSSECYKKFSVITGTVFEASNIPVSKWLHATYVVSGHKKGISSYQLARDIGISQKSAWFMIHRIRQALKEKAPQMLQGAIEADETYMARKYKSDFVGVSPEEAEFLSKHKQTGKGAVLGLAERGGNIRVFAFDNIKATAIRQTIKQTVVAGSRLLTDESNIYRAGLDEYPHASVKHSAREWVRFDVHTNTVENFWSVMKRGVHGIYHQISDKHFNEFSYRYNTRKITDKERFTLVLGNVTGRLTYKQLVHGKGKETSPQTA